MSFRPILLILVLVTAPFAAIAQDTAACDPSTTTCPPSDLGGSAGVNVDP